MSNKQTITNKIKHLIARLLFGQPLIMSVYKDKHGNNLGGTIHKNDGKSYIDEVCHIKECSYLGQIKIYI
jgi:hypothetical protein